jgi:hypothetical protein
MATYQILYWHDIPLQVRSGERRDRVSRELASRFQVAIDKAAMEAGIFGDDQYLNQFQWSEPQERDGDPAAVVAAVAAEIEARYPVIDWRKSVESIQAGGEATAT